MWYGFKKTPNLHRNSKNIANRLNWKDRRAGYAMPRPRTYPRVNHSFQVPAGWKFIALRPRSTSPSSTFFYAFSDRYFLNFVLTDAYVILTSAPKTRSVELQRFNTSTTYIAYLKGLTEVFQRFNKPFFLKIRFKGKGYYMYKNKRNTIAPQFGYAHRVYVYAFANSVKFLSKTKVLLFGMSKRDLFLTGYNLYRTRPINIFTGRGVRFARQVVYRKTGKIGAYR